MPFGSTRGGTIRSPGQVGTFDDYEGQGLNHTNKDIDRMNSIGRSDLFMEYFGSMESVYHSEYSLSLMKIRFSLKFLWLKIINPGKPMWVLEKKWSREIT